MVRILIVVSDFYLGFGNYYAVNSYIDALAAFPNVQCHVLRVENPDPAAVPLGSFDLYISWVNSFFRLPQQLQQELQHKPLGFLIYDFPLAYHELDIKPHPERVACWQRSQLFVYDRHFVDVFRQLNFPCTTYLPLALDECSETQSPAKAPRQILYPISFVGSLASPMPGHQKDDLAGHPALTSIYEQCKTNFLSNPAVPFWEVLFEQLKLPKDFMALTKNPKVLGCYDKLSKLLAYDVRQHFIRAVARDHEVHVFSRHVMDDVQRLKIKFHTNCNSVSDVMRVYKHSGVTLNFCHTQIIDTINQRYFNAPYQHCLPLSLINSVQHELLPGAGVERFTFSSAAELRDKLSETTRLDHSEVFQSWSDSVHHGHRYQNRWETILGQFGIEV